eukprot:CAMPEP_0178375628 /NCGR_PEP_ID=MMETSP0689_2-20121128/2986_1 /TAXON_ID=160604 /ORGANISM="Amphidinium massartii, Strain CS-259" /LENGTH=567 /DNA_ID=CAMNT_0019995627 /DNA_START=148 /DNA_END=1846 /DNA_ORIENTATION=-
MSAGTATDGDSGQVSCLMPPTACASAGSDRLHSGAPSGGAVASAKVVPPPPQSKPPQQQPKKAQQRPPRPPPKPKRQAGGLTPTPPKPKRQAGGFTKAALPAPPQPGRREAGGPGGGGGGGRRKYGGRGPGDGLLAGPIVRKDRAVYSYGNYNPYYHKRHDRFASMDPRVDAVLQLKGTSYFAGRSVLDMGCSYGFLTFLCAHLGARQSVGVDIDTSLISQALKQLRVLKAERSKNMFAEGVKPAGSPQGSQGEGLTQQPQSFPTGLVRSHGIVPYIAKKLDPSSAPLTASLAAQGHGESPVPFPFNIEFRTENVLSAEVEEMRKESYDIVLCLKLSKWVHLNWGDDGVQALFHKCFRVLKPGGELILEAQDLPSYKGRKHKTEHSTKVLSEMLFTPEHFVPYLTHSVGFDQPRAVGMAPPLKRPLLLFRRPGGQAGAEDRPGDSPAHPGDAAVGGLAGERAVGSESPSVTEHAATTLAASPEKALPQSQSTANDSTSGSSSVPGIDSGSTVPGNPFIPPVVSEALAGTPRDSSGTARLRETVAPAGDTLLDATGAQERSGSSGERP